MPNKTRGDVRVKSRSRRKYFEEEIKNGIVYESVITIKAPPDQIYAFWRDLRNLPLFMRHLAAIDVRSPRISHWTWRTLRDSFELQWDSQIVREVPGSLIAWRSLEGSTVAHIGEVSMRELPYDRGTEVRVILNYHPPGGAVTDFIGKILGESPEHTLKQDLHRLQQLMETGHIPTTEGQPHGGMDVTVNPVLYSHH